MVSQELDPISITDIENQKIIKTFEDLKLNLANNLLIYLQFDLPRDFNLIDLTKIPFNYRFMRNFSRSFAFSQSREQLKKSLVEYFNLEIRKQPQSNIKRTIDKNSKTLFKQVFFDIGDSSENKIIIDDTTHFDLENAPIESIKEVINEFETDKIKNDEKLIDYEESVRHTSSKFRSQDVEKNNQIVPELKIDQEDILELMKEFSITHTVPKKNDEETPINKEEKLTEALEILGIGNIKKNLGKSIISKKKKEGLFFDEWINENLEWVQFLIKNLAHIEYLSLKDESEYLAIVRNYKFSEIFDNEIKKLYKNLHIEFNEE